MPRGRSSHSGGSIHVSARVDRGVAIAASPHRIWLMDIPRASTMVGVCGLPDSLSRRRSLDGSKARGRVPGEALTMQAHSFDSAARVECLTSSLLAGLAEGQSASEDAHAHLAGCARCRLALTACLSTRSRRSSVFTDDENANRVSHLQRHALLPSGASLGRYVIDKLVGVGGMGSVYLARDQNLDRDVALKVLHRGEDDARRRSRVFREARALAKLSHPNVVAVYDADSAGNDVYLAMEFVDGQTLAEWLARGERSPRQVLDAFAQAGRGLSVAHAAGIAHRDFKPENVLVGREGRVRVTDFGLATLGISFDEEASATTEPARSTFRTTRNGTRGGTLAYMAPEQHAGGRADARSDQFSYCVALYEALYGSRPFGEPRAPKFVEAVLAGNVLPPSSSRIPRTAHAALLRGLRRNPSDRFASMEELMKALGMAPSKGVSAPASIAAIGFVAVVAGALAFGLTKEPQPAATATSLASSARVGAASIEPVTTDVSLLSNIAAIPPSESTRVSQPSAEPVTTNATRPLAATPSPATMRSARPPTPLPTSPRTTDKRDPLDRFD